MTDINCEKCTFRVGEGPDGKAAMEQHNEVKHPQVRRLSDYEEKPAPPAVEPEVKGTATPESTTSKGFGDVIRRKYGSDK